MSHVNLEKNTLVLCPCPKQIQDFGKWQCVCGGGGGGGGNCYLLQSDEVYVAPTPGSAHTSPPCHMSNVRKTHIGHRYLLNPRVASH